MPNLDYIQVNVPKEHFSIDPRKYTGSNQKNRDGAGGPRPLWYNLNSSFRRQIEKKTGIPADRLKASYTADYVFFQASAKILGAKYPNHINDLSFENYLNQLVDFGVFDAVDTTGIRNSGKVTGAEITSDFVLTRAVNQDDYRILELLNANPYRWSSAIFNNGITFRKTVKANKEKLTIYNKHIEMNLKRNDRFQVNYQVRSSFDKPSTMRVELKTFSGEGVTNHFGTNRLQDVLQSNRNPVAKVMKSIFVESSGLPRVDKKLTKKEMQRLVYACELDFDLRQIAKSFETLHNRTRDFRDVARVIAEVDGRTDESINIIRELLDSQSNIF